MSKSLAVIGGGAAGFFAAVNSAEACPDLRVVIFEAGSKTLSKVRISGGGRCNVTHSCFDVRELVKNYPRGSRELMSPFQRFQPQDTIEWFQKRGVELKTEEDGRMFPVTDQSETITQCLEDAAKHASVDVLLRTRIQEVRPNPSGKGFLLTVKPTGDQGTETQEFDYVLVATGSNPAGQALCRSLGHSTSDPVPSLFTFNIEDSRLQDLEGVSLPEVELSLESDGKKLGSQKGPFLVTHWGVSGPAVLKLSAWYARELFQCDYEFTLKVNFTPRLSEEDLRARLLRVKEKYSKKQIGNQPGVALPKRLAQRLIESAGILSDRKWSDVSKKSIHALVDVLLRSSFQVKGKSTFKDEFVTCGGVSLKEVDFKAMESKLVPGLYFAGEVLDVDAITGGFNFQNAWTGAWIASRSITSS